MYNLEQSNANHNLFKSLLNASYDGILIVDKQRVIVAYNEKFMNMWSIPQEVIKTCIDQKAMDYVLSQLNNPSQFMQTTMKIYENYKDNFHDEIYLRDGKIFERYTSPVISDKRNYEGRIWYFRDITCK